MNHSIKKALGVAVLAAIGCSAQAATLTALPSTNSVTVGSTFNVTIAIGDLIDAGAPSLGAFDLNVNFDANVLSYSGFSWGDTTLGDQLDLAHLGSFAQADTSHAAIGQLNYYELSFDDVGLLNNTQAGNFGLITLTFNALTNGASPIIIGVNALSDAIGNDLTAQVTNANINVSAVPLPSTLTLFTSALVLAIGRGRNRKPQ